ncbi:hypothetical protein PAXRUDRAFT_13609 [Paxillus rubicundulus Ve08.2h10]|uniref:Uncharacterized protein n=1 Tax=Paxillus rubicundulus Ve08.2h10 TaxID=930991 RepID=A0A0D0DTB8_9AGAM|nr:hypothetical protein PAXRUDRAFT_13609 [Paxillus rubicundulus Ve08.2h10]
MSQKAHTCAVILQDGDPSLGPLPATIPRLVASSSWEDSAFPPTPPPGEDAAFLPQSEAEPDTVLAATEHVSPSVPSLAVHSPLDDFLTSPPLPITPGHATHGTTHPLSVCSSGGTPLPASKKQKRDTGKGKAIPLAGSASSSFIVEPPACTPSLHVPSWAPPSSSVYTSKVPPVDSCPASTSLGPMPPTSLISFLDLASCLNFEDPSVLHLLHSSIKNVAPKLDPSSLLQALAASSSIPSIPPGLIPSSASAALLAPAPAAFPNHSSCTLLPGFNLSSSSSATSIPICTIPSNPNKLAGHQLADPKATLFSMASSFKGVDNTAHAISIKGGCINLSTPHLDGKDELNMSY